MSIKNIITKTKPSLVWVPKNPIWQNMVVGGRVLIQTYTVQNVSNKPVVIDSVGFEPGRDARIRNTGGTCVPGVRILPKATVALHIEVDPRTIGQVDQTLYVKPVDNSAILRVRIVFSVLARLGRKAGDKSFLVDDTEAMDRVRRLAEQEGHRHLAKVNARNHEQVHQSAPEQGLQNDVLLNPFLADSQRLDGIDTNLNPAPSINPEAAKELNDAQQQQELELQLRLGMQNTPQFTPKPRGP